MQWAALLAPVMLMMSSVMAPASLSRFTGAAKVRWFAFAAAALVAAAVGSAPTVLASEDGMATSDPFGGRITIGETLPNFSAVDQRGAPWSLSQETDKIVILHLCAIWCAPCRDLSRGLTAVIADLEADFGAETFEVVEVLWQNGGGNTSTLISAVQWAELVGSGLTVLHSDGDPDSEVAAFANATSRWIPQLIILDSQRRVADARLTDGGTAESVFRDAILHGLAVSEVPTDLSYAWQGPTSAELESPQRSGTGEFTEVTSPQFGSKSTASFYDDTGFGWIVEFFTPVQSKPGTIHFWNRVEEHFLALRPAVGSASPEAAITIRLDGYHWEDGYPRVVRRLRGVHQIGGQTVNFLVQEGEPQSDINISADGILTIGPIDVPDPWWEFLFFHVEIGAVWSVPKTPAESVQALVAEIESAGLSTGSYRSLVAPLSVAASLLGDDNLENDTAGWAAVRAVADRLRREGFRDVSSELAASWAAALDALTD